VNSAGNQEKVGRFKTAPAWLRPLLSAEDMVLRRVFRRRRDRARAELTEETFSGPDNVRVSAIGTLSSERLAPGEVRGWVFAHHLARYVWALPRVDGQRVLELGCGLGYGSDLMSWSASHVTGVDLDPEAISIARERYSGPDFVSADITAGGAEIPAAEVAVCFEVIEHVADPHALLVTAFERCPRLLLSMPNPLSAGSHINPHHRNDWPPTTLSRALRHAGASRIRWYRQGVRSATVRRGALPWSGVWLVDASR
jgi:2-polyprenyl-3-methyl-5-hydroxy-6-metoxy-1,4-benzoquinol methylase